MNPIRLPAILLKLGLAVWKLVMAQGCASVPGLLSLPDVEM
jgi:hypothetical protein